MKKAVLFFTLSFLSFLSFGQGRIGFTAEEIMADFPDYKFVHGVTDNGIKFIFSDDFKRGEVVYFFDEQGKSFLTMIVPRTTMDLNALVQLYNYKYVQISDTEWKAYLQNGSILKIELVNTDDLGMVIMIKDGD